MPSTWIISLGRNERHMTRHELREISDALGIHVPWNTTNEELAYLIILETYNGKPVSIGRPQRFTPRDKNGRFI